MYACIGAAHATNGRGARCRRTVERYGETCPQHNDVVVEEARDLLFPNVVLIVVNVNPRWWKRLQKAGATIFDKTTPEAVRREKGRIKVRQEEARRIVRSPWSYLPYLPTPATGTPVFGKTGACKVRFWETYEELRKTYGDPSVHLEIQRKKNKLVVGFEEEPNDKPSTDLVRVADKLLLFAAWQYVHVWANPPEEEEGRIVHTVHLLQRLPEEQREAKSLYFADGLWRLG